MGKNLVIVESPSKAKTIEKYLGKDYVVTSSYGHIRDLPGSKVSIDVNNGYEPEYVVSDEKKEIVTKLKKLAKDASEIYLATDEDREGEAISWHLCQILGLNPDTAKRITYTEVTKKAILDAIDHPRVINQDLVNAQQARRVLDRLVGYEISPILWRKVKPSLSAGRVQSVATKLIVEREREILSFKPTSSFKLKADFHIKDIQGNDSFLKAELKSNLKDAGDANDFLNSCVNAVYTIESIEKKPGKKSPSAPFTTSTLQQEASRKLGFSVAKTMLVAQKLYEAGHITYMRTDSPNLSDTAILAADQEINKRFGKKYHYRRNFAAKSKGAQEAHEAIRPADMSVDEVNADFDGKRLYDLIWKRTIASQMAFAEIEKTIVDISISTNKQFLTASGEVVLFDGFLKVYSESSDSEDEEEGTSAMLPPLTQGQILDLAEMVALEKYTKPAARYTEASLVKKMEELGIGRPSTYAPTISTIQNRGYVHKGNLEGKSRKIQQLTLKNNKISKAELTENYGFEKAKLFPMDIGMMVTDFLEEHFKDIMNYQFTAKVEEEFDEIAVGELEWSNMIDRFYKPFKKNIDETAESANRVSKERLLGHEAGTNHPIYAKLGKFGPMIQIGEGGEGNEKPRFAKMKKTQSIDTITLDEAMQLFVLPRNLGELEGKEVVAAIGRFGPYVRHDGQFYSIPKTMDVYEIELDEAINLVKEGKEKAAKKLIHDFKKEGIQVLNGRYGPYIKKGRDNFKIPKGVEAENLDADMCEKIISEAGNAPKKGKKKSK